MGLLSNTPVHHAVPYEYVLPPEKRPEPDELVDPTVTLPVIDLAAGRRRHLVVNEIIKAGKEFGFFQVVNHGVGDEVVGAFRSAAAEFFAMPAEEKLPYYSDDLTKPFRVDTSTTYVLDRSGGGRYWRDYLQLQCFPVDRFSQDWPAEPAAFVPSLAAYATAVQTLAATLLGLIAEGLGLEESFFRGELSGGGTLMNVNWYPPCPDPSLTLGLLPHCDRPLLTVLSQGDVSGLQAKHKGRWIAVQPVPNAFVINFGHLMEIVTNGLLQSVEHRAVTNSSAARLSVVTIMLPDMDCRIEPAPALVTEGEQAKFRPFLFREFNEAYAAAAANRADVLQRFRIYPAGTME
ncbi:2'-deoxymugineic-acid 2'-dioxygenase-like [Triticum urartu]|uniref:Fe2OG dioxygenase domain-containing protein n=1 Tax=Triticum urartu TaxID=4572 RepID=A0A8R7P3A1_TRIUA|nr:2'-deoxymugineic-acid 2'-dioxygenase-like [Triticum urartu]